jgi:hypothetical protein
MGGTGLEPVTSCVSNIISAHKYLPFIPLCAFFWRKYRFHTGYILATYCHHTANKNKNDVRMTPEAV